MSASTRTATGRCLLFVGILAATGCFEEGAPPAPFQPVGGIQPTMALVLEPAADKVWDSAGFIITESEVEDLSPTTDEGWNEVRHAAAVVAETGNLLMMPGRTMPGDDWMEIAAGLIQAGMRAMAAAERQDAEALFTAGGEIYNVCVSCHQLYWPAGSFRVDESTDLSSTQPPLQREDFVKKPTSSSSS